MTTATVPEHTTIIPDAISPPGRRFWVTPEMVPRASSGLPVPSFNVSVTAQVFFGRSASWLRLHMRPSEGFPEGSFVLDGTTVVEPQRSRSAFRVFSLADIEPMAYALAQNGVIDQARLVAAVNIAKWVARTHGILKDQ